MMSTNPRSFEARKEIYLNLYKTMIPNYDAEKIFDAWYLKKIEFQRKSYESVGAKLGIPWYVIACIHAKECSLDMARCLHNGQPWNQVTTMVPRGRGPWNSWEEAAVDALIYDGLHLVKQWSIEYILWSGEKYNGFGYMQHKVNTPYLWSGSNHYTKGLYKEKPLVGSWFDSEAKANDLGIAVMIKCMEQKGLIQLKYESDFISLDDTLNKANNASGAPVTQKPVENVVPTKEPQNKKSFSLFAFLKKLFSRV